MSIANEVGGMETNKKCFLRQKIPKEELTDVNEDTIEGNRCGPSTRFEEGKNRKPT